MVRLGIVGDFEASRPNHLATEAALEHAARLLGVTCQMRWIPTDAVSAPELRGYDGFLIAPGNPYRSCDGALLAIEHARLHDVPLLGTCGGFQHVVLEFARNVLGIKEAEHGEYDPYASKLFVTPLSCSLAGQTMSVRIERHSKAGSAYGISEATEHYYCNFGLNLEYLDELVAGGLQVTGTDQDGEPRIIELNDRRYFLATLFVPQTSSTPEAPHPLIVEFVKAASDYSCADETYPNSSTQAGRLEGSDHRAASPRAS